VDPSIHARSSVVSDGENVDYADPRFHRATAKPVRTSKGGDMGECRLIGRSAQHRDLLTRLARVASTDAEVLLTGPSGVGKELYARFLHHQSPRSGAPFVAVNCGLLSADLFENELFGHVAGAFTGARGEKLGLVAAAERGTLFLDEVDALAPSCQAKLLRFIQEKEFRPLGDHALRRADVRFVAATNAELERNISDGRFRADLFFRLRVVPLAVAPLAERPDDIPPLTDEFVTRYAAAYQAKPIVLSDGARARLASYAWPGNVRELENCVRFLTCVGFDRPVEASDLPLLAQPTPPALLVDGDFDQTRSAAVRDLERRMLETALRRTSGNITQAARIAGKQRRTFFTLLRRHGIDATTFRAQGRR
jgi:DNA-binding NtrC family response regulator